jgi:DNA end-binding protein Ku
MRPIWTGAITFGLIYIPVKLYPATEEQGLDFDLLRKGDLCPIRYARVCSRSGDEVPWEEIVKGHKLPDGRYVVVTDEDFKSVAPEQAKTIEIVSFADGSEIDLNLLEKPYYVEPDKGAGPAYALLRDAMQHSSKVGISRYVLRNRGRPAVLRPDGKILILHQLRFATEVRDPAKLDAPATGAVKQKELDMAVKLVQELSEPFVASDFSDTYSEQLLAFIRDKAAGKAHEPVAEEPVPAEMTDLFAKLRASLEEAQERKGR